MVAQRGDSQLHDPPARVAGEGMADSFRYQCQY